MTNYKTQAVYKQWIAAKLNAKGHEIIGMLPNPKKPNYQMWIFVVDETFYQDLDEILGKEANNGSK